MGHHNSKSATTKKLSLPKTDVPPTTLSQLERAVLNKNISEVRRQLINIDDINETGAFGLSLLHLAIVPTLFTSDLENYYDHYYLMDQKVDDIAPMREIIAFLAERGAVLVPASDKINPLEFIYYFSLTNKTLCDQLTMILFDLIQFSIPDITRYTVWKLVCGRFNSKLMPDQRMHHNHLIALFVKHGIMADEYFSGLTERPAPFQHCCDFREMFIFCFCRNSICSGHDLEFTINIWHKFWEFNDPRTVFLNYLLEHFVIHFAHNQRTKLLTVKFISLWLSPPPRHSQSIYRMICFISRIYKINTRDMAIEELSTQVGDFALFKSFIYLLPNIILTIKDTYKLRQSVDAFIKLCFNMYQLLVKLYGNPNNIPYYEVEVFSDSFNHLLPHLPAANHGPYRCNIHDYTPVYSFNDRDLYAFMACFDPDINVRHSDTGRSSIQESLLYGNIYMVQTLLESGANPFTVDREGHSFINLLDSIILSLGTGPAKDVYEDVKNQYVILNKPYSLVTIASIVIVKARVPFDVLKRQPRLYHMLLHYLPPD